MAHDPNLVLLVVNPNAGARQRPGQVMRLTAALRQEGLRVETIHDLDGIAPACDRAMANGELKAITAAGGDGTLSAVVNRASPQAPIAVVPWGTENLLARHFSLPSDPLKMAAMIRHGRCHELDAGSASGRLFLIVASCGFDAEVVRRLHMRRRGNISQWSYLEPITSAMRNYEYPELTVTSSENERLRGRWLFLFNLPRYAWGLPIAPSASATDGELDLYLFEKGSWLDALRYLAAIMVGAHARLPDCIRRVVKSALIESDSAAPFQLDGDPGGSLPCEVRVLPRRLRLVLP